MFFVRRFSSLKRIVGIILGLYVMSFVKRLIILCPYLEESSIESSTIIQTVQGQTNRYISVLYVSHSIKVMQAHNMTHCKHCV